MVGTGARGQLGTSAGSNGGAADRRDMSRAKGIGRWQQDSKLRQWHWG